MWHRAFFLTLVIFAAGCGQVYNSTLIKPNKIGGIQKIQIGPIDCDSNAGKAILVESLKQELQKKGYVLVESDADIIISGPVVIARSPWDLTPAVTMAVIYVQGGDGTNYGLIKSKTGSVNSVSPEDFAKKVAQKIHKNFSKKP